MNFIEDSGTQYKDYQGSASLDFHGIHPTLNTLAAELGLDLKRFRPVGLQLQIWNNLKENIQLVIYVVERESESDGENIYNVTRVNCEIESQKLFGYFKELIVTLTEPNEGKIEYRVTGSKHINELQNLDADL